MVEILIDTFRDVLQVVPLMLVIFLAVDWLVARLNQENQMVLRLSRYDALGGGLLGIIPQCGISVSLARLYCNGYISLGMLTAVFLSTSDEALIIIGAHPRQAGLVLKIILIKLLLAVGVGYVLNLIVKEKRNRLKGCGIDCACPRCRKSKNLFRDSLIHTLKITAFLIVTVFLINLGLERLGGEKFLSLLGKNTWLQPIYASLIGMIPSCFSSVFLAESYIEGAIGFGALIAGLCANTGYGILVILKELPLKKALKIILMVQVISMLTGEIIGFVNGG